MSAATVTLRPLRTVEPATVVHRTPLVASRLINGVYWKLEGCNPTGTFKDRVMQRLVGEALRTGAVGAVVASSGNAAAAAAAACARAGLPLLALVPAGTDPARLAPLRLRSVPVVEVAGDPSTAYAAAAALVEHAGLAELPSTFRSPATEEACRAVGHEIVAELGGPPAALSAAISVGPILVGAGHGVTEASGARPALLGAQAAGCAPIAAAFDAGHDTPQVWTEPITTKAASIADRLTGYAHEGAFTARSVRASGGFVAAYDDRDLLRARRDLAAVDGIDVELASAAAVCAAAAWHGPRPVVGVLTGVGTRETIAGLGLDGPNVDPRGFAERVEVPDLLEVLAAWMT